MTEFTVTLLDYGAGNVRSVRNALTLLGVTIKDVQCADDIVHAERLLFPGVGAYPQAVAQLNKLDYMQPLKQYLQSNKPFFGMCLGMQILFNGSTERSAASDNTKMESNTGLGIFDAECTRFGTNDKQYPVPHIGWNSLVHNTQHTDTTLSKALFTYNNTEKYYFVHSYCVKHNPHTNEEYVLTYTDYGNTRFISTVNHNNILATQFHPEKSSTAGSNLLYQFLKRTTQGFSDINNHTLLNNSTNGTHTTQKSELSKRIIACLDVRSNDNGDLVVTKGDSYNVRETSTNGTTGQVRNLGKPVELAQRYYTDGADEITFLNITSFRAEPLNDSAMLALLQSASKRIFVPLCVGGGIRDYTDADGKQYSALDVAAAYFRAGADKVSIGSDAVIAAEQYYQNKQNNVKSTVPSSVEQISYHYGAQAMVVSIDPRKVYVQSPSDTTHHTVKLTQPGPNGEPYAWYQCTIKGGREGRDLDVVQLAQAVEALGAGELLVNSIDADGQKNGYDLQLLQQICNAISIPVIASSGAGALKHFSDVFEHTSVNAALAAGIFHRQEISIEQVKQHMLQHRIPTRQHIKHNFDTNIDKS